MKTSILLQILMCKFQSLQNIQNLDLSFIILFSPKISWENLLEKYAENLFLNCKQLAHSTKSVHLVHTQTHTV